MGTAVKLNITFFSLISYDSRPGGPLPSGPAPAVYTAFPVTLQGISNSARLEALMPETGTGKAI